MKSSIIKRYLQLERRISEKKRLSLQNILKEDVNTYVNIFKEDKKQMNEFYNKLAKQI